MLVTVARCYRSDEASLVSCWLESSGLRPFLAHYQMHVQSSYCATALQGIEIQVPCDQVDEANQLLDALPEDFSKPPKHWMIMVAIIVFLGWHVPFAIQSGLYLTRSKAQDRVMRDHNA